MWYGKKVKTRAIINHRLLVESPQEPPCSFGFAVENKQALTNKEDLGCVDLYKWCSKRIYRFKQMLFAGFLTTVN